MSGSCSIHNDVRRSSRSAAVSSVLCFATLACAVQWLRSYGHIDNLGVGRADRQVEVTSTETWVSGSNAGGFNFYHWLLEERNAVADVRRVKRSGWYLIANSTTARTILYPGPLCFTSKESPGHSLL